VFFFLLKLHARRPLVPGVTFEEGKEFEPSVITWPKPM
jgi:hypothetical protein